MYCAYLFQVMPGVYILSESPFVPVVLSLMVVSYLEVRLDLFFPPCIIFVSRLG